MLMAHLLLILYGKIVNRISSQVPELDKPEDIEATKKVIIAGYDRLGQIIDRKMNTQRYHLLILDHSPSQISMLKKFSNKFFMVIRYARTYLMYLARNKRNYWY